MMKLLDRVKNDIKRLKENILVVDSRRVQAGFQVNRIGRTPERTVIEMFQTDQASVLI